MSDVKECPYCAEMIKVQAVICRHCGRDLKTGKPPVVKTKQDTRLGLIAAICLFIMIGMCVAAYRVQNAQPAPPPIVVMY